MNRSPEWDDGARLRQPAGMLRGMGDDEAACYSRLSVLSDIFVFPN
jgi:hypothetical protein